MKQKPLLTRLWRARTLLKHYRKAVLDSEVIRGGPADGTLPLAAQNEIADFDEAIATLTEAIRQERRKAA